MAEHNETRRYNADIYIPHDMINKTRLRALKFRQGCTGPGRSDNVGKGHTRLDKVGQGWTRSDKIKHDQTRSNTTRPHQNMINFAFRHGGTQRNTTVRRRSYSSWYDQDQAARTKVQTRSDKLYKAGKVGQGWTKSENIKHGQTRSNRVKHNKTRQTHQNM